MTERPNIEPTCDELVGSNKCPLVICIDTGWQSSSEISRVEPGYTICWNDEKEEISVSSGAHDDNGHGTQCIDVLLKTTRSARVIPIKALDASGQSDLRTLSLALQLARRLEPDIIAMFLGATDVFMHQALRRECDECLCAGAILFASQTSEGPLAIPGAFPSVVSVRCRDLSEAPALVARDLSGRSDLVALGLGVGARGADGSLNAVSGSSVACAIATGIFASLLANESQANTESMLPVWRGAIRSVLRQKRALLRSRARIAKC